MTALANVEAETAVLAAMLLDGAAAEAAADILRPEHFSEHFYGHVFDLLVRERSRGQSLTPFTLKPHLEGMEAFQQLGGFAWLADLTRSAVPVLAAIPSAKQVRSLAERRQLVAGLGEAIASANGHSISVEELAELADKAISDARSGNDEGGEYSASAALDMVIGSFDQPVTGVLCKAIPSIDFLLGPMRPTHMVVGAGRPGMGKTATAISYALGAAQQGHGVLFVSLEMGAEQLAERMAADLCLDSRVPYASIRDRELTSEQKREVCRARERLADMPLQILDKQGLRIGRLRTLVRRWARRFEARGHKLQLVVVDYLQLLRADQRMDRFEAVSEISRSLKELAKEQGLAVLALSQLSREVEKRADKRPQLSDLRESGQIEQDADAVLFFLRHEYYLRQAEPDASDPRHEEWQRQLSRCAGGIEFICAKRRNGQAGSRVGQFLGQYQAVRG